MHQGLRVTIVVPAYNEAATIAAVVDDFRAHPSVDEVLVIDNRSKDTTGSIARERGARVVHEEQPGYGFACRRGFDEAQGEIVVLTEADGSFRAFDLDKFLAYINSAPFVLGTRTTRQMVQQGANMGFLVRWCNVAMAKILELLWFYPHEPRLTDVGCSYRAIRKDAWMRIRGGCSHPGPAFSPEMICEGYRHGLRVVEIPVHYYARLGGESKHSDSFMKLAKTAAKMFQIIIRKRLETAPRPAVANAPATQN
ncbi:MAG: glycosyltransferase family 2 protein [Planctomycetes bacterium]|nr:glycosyltransferase family 2 protein [Planctomycetota bacterium]